MYSSLQQRVKEMPVVVLALVKRGPSKNSSRVMLGVNEGAPR